ncbi:MAG: Uma2 family endonuclease [Desulfobacterales bacterium]|nr:Uma2 family endonuclease [Desulfobacterales bacterium]
MSLAVQKASLYTYGDYLNWPDDERWELIQGEPYDMSPAPLFRHQRISMELSRQIANFLTDKPCEVVTAPVDVRLPENDEADEDVVNVIQPDIVVVCDKSKIDRRGVRGAPDLIVEILSKSTAAKDQIQKVALYEAHGVSEYWIIHPVDNLLTKRVLGDDGKYGPPAIYPGEGRQSSAVFPDLSIDLDAVFR